MPTSPTSGPGGGGGGVTAPVVIPSGGRTVVPLSISGAPTQDANFFEVEGTSGYFEIQADGAGGIDRIDMFAERHRIATANTDLNIFGDSIVVDAPAFIFGAMTVAPASALFTQSQFSFWLDDTVGAAKLMVKAKDVGGNVVTAAIALT